MKKTILLLLLLIIPTVLADFAYQPKITLSEGTYDQTFGTYVQTTLLLQNTQDTLITINITPNDHAITPTQITLAPKEKKQVPINIFINQPNQETIIRYSQNEIKYSGATIIQSKIKTNNKLYESDKPQNLTIPGYEQAILSKNKTHYTELYTSPLNNITFTYKIGLGERYGWQIATIMFIIILILVLITAKYFSHPKEENI